ncbi:hypothetical protein ACFE04_029019 [Oxalis oulophora]
MPLSSSLLADHDLLARFFLFVRAAVTLCIESALAQSFVTLFERRKKIDPQLALALKVSMEEERVRQEAAAKKRAQDATKKHNNNNNKKKKKKKKSRLSDSLVNRFRRKSGLFVTDITASEWCEKQVDLLFQYGKPKATRAMKADTARHAKLEQGVIQRVQVQICSLEDKWAIKLMNFIVGANQLFFDGMTRELPCVWVVGVIDEIRMPIEETSRSPLLVDTKTRVRDTFPSEPQRRNGRLQLMCYKYLWDNLVAGNLQWTQFFDFFALDRYSPLSDEIIEMTANSGCPSKTLDDMVKYFRNACSMLPLADKELLEAQHFSSS